MRAVATVAGLVALVLAGCSGTPPPESGAPLTLADGTVAGPGTFLNYTTLHTGGEPFTRTYDGVLTPQEAAQSNSVPFGASATVFQTCCSFDWIAVTDLLQQDQLVALRLTLTWTNTQNDRAGFDVAACLPWACNAFNQGGDESQSPGAQTDVMTIISSGRADWAEMGMAYQVGVRFTNAVLTAGMPYTIAVEAFPVENGLAVVDPYTVQVAENATLTAELLGPFQEGGVSLALMAYDGTDRPIQWFEFTGPHGSRHDFTLPAGDYVLIPMQVGGGFARLSTDVPPASLQMERLQEEFSQVEVAAVPDARQHSGTFSYAAPPGTIDPFPVFLYADGARAQDLFGASPTDVGGAQATLKSSSGDIVVVDQQEFSVQAGGQQSCLQCTFSVPAFNPQNFIDDDGTYDLDWASSGAAGTFTLFTARYLR